MLPGPGGPEGGSKLEGRIPAAGDGKCEVAIVEDLPPPHSVSVSSYLTGEIPRAGPLTSPGEAGRQEHSGNVK